MTGHPIDHRKLWLASLINDKQLTLGAELGVHEAVTHLHLLENCPQLTMIGVDLYKGNQEKYFESVVEQLHHYGDRSIFYRESTFTAHNHINDESLDFVFIDADHSSQGVRKDITNWLPKVKPGGYMIGHDYTKHSVKTVVDSMFNNVQTGPDLIWYFNK